MNQYQLSKLSIKPFVFTSVSNYYSTVTLPLLMSGAVSLRVKRYKLEADHPSPFSKGKKKGKVVPVLN
jgi:hypothetical protein